MFLAIGDMVHGKLTFHLLSLDLHPDSKIIVPFNGYFDRFDGKLWWNKKKLVICNNAV